MATIRNEFEQSQLSTAAYALDLKRGAFGSQNSEYVTSLKVAGMSQKQAELFADRYSVVDQYSDVITGFSGTVFDKNGDKYIAIRGTQNLFTFSGKVDWLTNVQGIGEEGIAITQSLAMFDWLQRLSGKAGNAVVQYFFNPITRTVETTTGIANGLLERQSSVTVSGHSLGGQLAMIMSRLAPDLVSAAYTFNAPGFDTLIGRSLFPLTSEGFFSLLREAVVGPLTGEIGNGWDTSIMSHINVNGDVVHGIGVTPGNQNIVFTESENQGIIDTHSIGPITDALAVFNLLESLDKNIRLNATSSILRSVNNKTDASLETIVNTIGKLVAPIVNESDRPGVKVAVPIGDRDQLYTNISTIQSDLTDSATLTDSGFTIINLYDLPSQAYIETARTDSELGRAFRYALRELNPFVLISTHSSTNKIIYDALDQNSNLLVGFRSDIFLAARAELPNALIKRNNEDIPDQDSVGLYITDKVLEDVGKGIRISVRDPQNEKFAEQIRFGSSDSNLIEGGMRSDKLFGLLGADTLIGNGDADYLEGNAGNDVLVGGRGTDNLVGGRDNDTLFGGDFSNGVLVDDVAQDLLVGGAGDDVYHVGINDIIEDNDGQGTIILHEHESKGSVSIDFIESKGSVSIDFMISERGP